MSRRRHKEEEHDNHERWLVSYGDFITLLFAFFVVMYALSSVNEGKYRVLSNSLSAAFHEVPSPTAGSQVDIRPGIPNIVPSRKISTQKPDELTQWKKERTRKAANEIMAALAPLVKSGLVNVTENGRGITIDINASVLFAPGDAHLSAAIVPELATVGRILSTGDFPLVVEGHTDNVPINTPQFPSNWELSGMRASSVVRLFVENGVDPSRLTATGYADQRPVDSNTSVEGRQRNRRVSITLESQVPDAGDISAKSPAALSAR